VNSLLALSLRGHISPASAMTTAHFMERPGNMQVLDFWTQRTLDAYWENLVRDAIEAEMTGSTDEEPEDTMDTSHPR